MTLPANRPAIAWPNYMLPQYERLSTATRNLITPTAVGGSGSWQASASLSNLVKTYPYQRLVRSTNATPASSQFIRDFGQTIQGSVFALIGHNLTPAIGYAQWRVRAGTSSSFPANLVTNPDALASGWTVTGTTTVANNVATYGGRSFSRVTIGSGTVSRPVTLTGNGVKRCSARIHTDGGAATFVLMLHDATAPGARWEINGAISAGGVVTITAQVHGTATVRDVGNGVYFIEGYSEACTAANTHSAYAFAGGSGTSVLVTRVSVEDMPTSVLIDSGWMNAYQPSHDAGSFPSGVTVDSTNAPTIDELIHYRGLSLPYIHPTVEAFRYTYFEVDDPTNTNGYIEFGKGAFVGPGWFPQGGAELGAALTWRDPSQMTVGRSGIRRFDQQFPYRALKLTLGNLPVGQAIGWPWRMEGRLGLSQELFVCLDPTSANYVHEFSFLALQEELSGIAWTNALDMSKPASLVERV